MAGAIATRLLLICAVFGLALLLEWRGGGPYSERTLTALYGLVAFGFILSLGYGVAARAGRVRELPWIELCGDGMLASGLVYSTGGASSLFGFLYVGWIVYATMRLGRKGTAVSAVAATVGFGLIAWATVNGWLVDGESTLSTVGALEIFGRHAAAFGLVGMLAQRLGRELTLGREELRELSELHRRIVDHMPSGLVTVEGNTRVSSFNHEAERITGYQAREVLGRPLSWLFPGLRGFLHSDDADPRAGVAGRNADPRSVLRRAFAFEHRDGAIRHLGFSSATLRSDSGEREGTVIIFQDLTRIVEMEDQLGRSERLAAVGQLAAGLAHEIRNPLASLSGSIELLEAELPELGSDATKLFGIVQRETARLNRLLTEFLDFARPEPRKRESVPLVELWRDLETLLAADPSIRGRLDLRIPPGLAVLGDPDRLRQVFWNLLLNAAQAEPVDGVVRIRASSLEGDHEVEISIEDRGHGIPEDILPRVFDPFFTTKKNGSGLGLAAVHRIVEAHGGRILVSSEEGKGTSVRIVLLAAGLRGLPARPIQKGTPWQES